MGVLDDLSLTAFRAYSTRKVRSAYSGSCLRVRRDSDSAETDIGFDGDDLDVAAIAAHCTTASGYVVTWYDQSTSGVNLTQSTAARQLLIYDGEAVNTVGDASMPALLRQYTDTSNSDFMTSSTTWAIPDALSCHVAFTRPTAGQSMTPLLKNGYFYNGPSPFWHSDNIVYWRPGAGDFSNTDPDGSTHAFGSASTATGLFTLLGARSSTARQVYRNGTSLGTISDDYNNPVWDADASAMERTGSTGVYSLCEIIVFQSTLTGTNATDLYDSVDGYWNGAASDQIAGGVTGAASLAGAIVGRGAVAGGVTGAASLAGAVTGRGAVAGTVTGAASLAGALSGLGTVAGTVTGAASLAGALSGLGTVAGSATGAAALVGAVVARGVIAGDVTGAASLTGQFLTDGLQGSIAGAASLTCALTGRGMVAGTVAGASALVGALVGRGVLSGSVTGAAALVGAVLAGDFLTGSINGTASLVAVLVGRGSLAGSTSGLATITGRFQTAPVVVAAPAVVRKKVLVKQMIHQALTRLLKEGPFYPVTVNHKTGAMVIDTDRKVKPTGIVTKEVRASWAEPSNLRRTYGPSEMRSWSWVARVQFAEEVACEEFEQTVAAAGIQIRLSDPLHQERRVLARLVSSDYDHPPEQSPNRGSTVTFVFEIVPETLRK